MKKLDLVEVEWEDTTSDRRWEGKDNVSVIPAIICNVGWQLQLTKKHILLTSQKDITFQEFAERIRIPRGCVKSIRRIE